MGTKNNPDEFDCYSKALPDEPTFTLLARDRHMPSAVNDWADNRELEIRRGYGGDKEKLAAELRQLQRAREVAVAAANWRRNNMGVWKGALTNKLSATADMNDATAEFQLSPPREEESTQGGIGFIKLAATLL